MHLLLDIKTIDNILCKANAIDYQLGVALNNHNIYYDKRDLWPILIRSGFISEKIKRNIKNLILNLLIIIKKSNVFNNRT